MIDFAQRALIAGVGIAAVAGPLGSLVIWRRMAYFGDTLAHSTLLGLSLSLILHVNIYFGLIGMTLLLACLLGMLTQQKWLASDAILGLLSHTILALGLIVATTIPGARVDLLSYLYGDILSVNMQDIMWIYSVSIVVIFFLAKLWRWLLSITIDADLAITEGIPVKFSNWSFIIMLALVFAVAIKLVGVLLITALLIIPASAARKISKSPETMAVMASIYGAISVACGIIVSLSWDWPTGPAIVVSAATIFLINLVVGSKILNNTV